MNNNTMTSFKNFEPGDKDLKLVETFETEVQKRSPKGFFLKSQFRRSEKLITGIAKIYHGNRFYRVEAEGRNLYEILGKLRSKLNLQLKRWRANNKSHPHSKRHLKLSF
ncbi:MAG: hypothetical protein AB8E15_06325 [Bdellovibrionales bacterium]